MYKPKFKLRDVLELICGSSEPLPDTWVNGFENIKPDSTYMVCLCFMCEEETWVKTYPTHPLLIPWYDCMVVSITPTDEDTLEIWLDYEPFVKNMIGLKEDEDGKNGMVKITEGDYDASNTEGIRDCEQGQCDLD